jgi:hypothetical protein
MLSAHSFLTRSATRAPSCVLSTHFPSSSYLSGHDELNVDALSLSIAVTPTHRLHASLRCCTHGVARDMFRFMIGTTNIRKITTFLAHAAVNSARSHQSSRLR